MDYRTTCRRTEMTIPGLLAVLLFLGAGTWFAFARYDTDRATKLFVWVVGLSLAAIAVLFAATYRLHRWTLLADGLAVSDQPRVPLLGRSRTVHVGFADIAAFRRVEHGLDTLFEIATRNGRTFRIGQALVAGDKGFGVPDPAQPLGTFLEAIAAAASAAGNPLPPLGQGLSFWTALPGLLVQAAMLALATLIAIAAAWMLAEGGFDRPGARAGYGAALALLLPVGAGWMLARSLRRRRAVLRGDG